MGSGVDAAGVDALGVGSGVGVGRADVGAAVLGPRSGEWASGSACPGPAEPMMIKLAAARAEPTLMIVVRRRTGKQ